MDWNEAAQRAIADLEAAVGTVIRPAWLHGYRDDHCHEIQADGAVEVRVLPTAREDVLHTTDGWLDPYWDVEIVSDPDGLTAGYRSFWTWGASYEFKDGLREAEKILASAPAWAAENAGLREAAEAGLDALNEAVNAANSGIKPSLELQGRWWGAHNTLRAALGPEGKE